ncbi:MULTISPECIES: putative quinol monooxygenase [unclassified Microbacterium]|uniref:antibiotic biosynthesis monooxygenase family protein n=1 Tax=unclassified Microbacterium TaxID=2609290 RepID=UPI00214C9F8B|nr:MULTISPECIES: putative quinol monooxygenase [unclassified Microbacterium]MCR2783094.1 antibiotic biosynthesis monooxygenase [Microbacterium sp. zg.B96]MDL5352122.1 putative quinol monooxygenase [Microbacterium sp. zg-YB36]WIM16022.1 putative quinol monooxygenase [Microbacterium sp. zg-B96]
MALAALVTMTPQPGRRAELEAKLGEVLNEVRKEPGNLLALVLRDPKNPDKVYEFAVFQDEAAIEAHQRAEHAVQSTPIMKALQQWPYAVQRFETVDWIDEVDR